MNLDLTKKSILFWGFFLLIMGVNPQWATAQFGIIWDETYGGSVWEEMNAALSYPERLEYVFGGMTSSNGSFTVDGGSFGGGDVWLVWTDTTGQVKRQRRYGGSGNERLQNMRKTPDGGMIFIGTTDSADLFFGNEAQPNFGLTDMWVVKLDIFGNVEWHKTFGGDAFDFGMIAIPTASGDYLIGGTSYSGISPIKSVPSFGAGDIWLMRLDSKGDIIWQKNYGGLDLETVTAGIETIEGEDGFIIAGASFSEPANISGVGNKTTPLYGKQDWWYFKIDDNGNLVWQQGDGLDGQDDILDILITLDNKYFISGFTERNPADTLSYGKEDLWVQKINTNGDKIWEQIYGGSELDWAYAAVQNGLGNYVVGGVSLSDTSEVKRTRQIGGRDYWVLHLDVEGNLIWEETFGGDKDDVCTKVIKAIGGGYILAGHSQSAESEDKTDPNFGMNDMWVIRTGCELGNPQLPDLMNICEGEEVVIDATTTPCQGCTYLWNDGFTGNIRTVDTDVDFEEYSVLVVHKDACETSDTFTVQTVPNPTYVLVDIDSVTCYGDNDGAVYVDGVLGGTPPFTTVINDEIYEDFAEVPDFLDLAAGVFDIEVVDANNCRTDTTVVVETPNEPRIILPDDTLLELGDSLQILALATPEISTFYWTDPALVSCDTCLNPFIKPDRSLSIGLVGADKNGCIARDVMAITVDRTVELFIPNIFSPNGDGHNDYFAVFSGKGVDIIKSLKVFDRWGQLMFKATEMLPNMEANGWDGTFRGQPKSMGVYVYTMDVQYKDGRIETIQGDVTLSR